MTTNTRFIVLAIYNGTKQSYAFAGRNPESAISKARKDKYAGKASAYIVHSRKTNKVVAVCTN